MSNDKKGYVTKKKNMNFQSVESLQSVVNVVNEAAVAVDDKKRTIRESAIPEVLAGALGAGIGGVGSFAALYGLGSVVGLSAAGITSGLAAAGGIVGGGNLHGDKVLARLNGGEMVLNRTQQAKLFRTIESGNIGNQSASSVSQVNWKIKGSDLYGALTNYKSIKSKQGKRI